MLASAVISAAGSVAGGISQQGQANYETGIAQNNAVLARQQAQESIDASKKENKDYWRDVARQKGEMVAASAANGVDVGFGTPQRLADDAVMLSREDADAMYKNQSNRTRGFIINAGNFVSEAKAAKSRGKAALVGGVIQGASTLVGAATQYKGKRQSMGQKGWF